MSARRIAALAATTAVAAAAAVPASASAAAIAVDRGCYDNFPGNVITIIGSGFTPGDTVDLQAPEVFQSATVASNGTFATQVPVPPLSFSAPGTKSFDLKATSELSASVVAAAPFRVANFAVATKPAHANPTIPVKFSFSGWISGRPIYGHFLLHGKLRVTKRYGKAEGACGVLKSRAPLYPGPHPRFGRYQVQFDQSRRYHKRNRPRLVTHLNIFRTFHL